MVAAGGQRHEESLARMEAARMKGGPLLVHLLPLE
jgi:hypothetical protein